MDSTLTSPYRFYDSTSRSSIYDQGMFTWKHFIPSPKETVAIREENSTQNCDEQTQGTMERNNKESKFPRQYEVSNGTACNICLIIIPVISSTSLYLLLRIIITFDAEIVAHSNCITYMYVQESFFVYFPAG